MRRVYNSKISERANRSLIRREAQVRAQKGCIGVAIIVILALGILFGTGSVVFAFSGEEPVLHTYYTSICVQAGDTLWDIAGEYAQDAGMSRQEYIDEVCRLNGICVDEIYAGEYLVVMYYVVE